MERLQVLTSHVSCGGGGSTRGAAAKSRYSGPDAVDLHRAALDSGATRVDTGADTVLCRIEHGVGVVVLNQPKLRNALGDRLSPFLRVALRRMALDDRVRCVLLTGAGSAFCSGGNVGAMAGTDKDATESPPPPTPERTNWAGLPLDSNRDSGVAKMSTLSGVLWEMGKPTIAALPGVAAGAGLSIALACDIRVGNPHTFVTTAFRNVALSGDYGGSWLLTRCVGQNKAKELYYTADRVHADECLRLGILQRVVKEEELHAAAFGLAKGIAEGPRHAIRLFKRNINAAAEGNSFREGIAEEGRSMDELLGSAEGKRDFKEAVMAFAQRRKPRFT